MIFDETMKRWDEGSMSWVVVPRSTPRWSVISPSSSVCLIARSYEIYVTNLVACRTVLGNQECEVSHEHLPNFAKWSGHYMRLPCACRVITASASSDQDKETKCVFDIHAFDLLSVFQVVKGS